MIRARYSLAASATLGFVLAILLSGCLDEPPIEDQWSRLEILASSEDGSQLVDLASGQQVTMSAKLTYRQIITGAIVAELRASDTITAESVELNSDDQKIGTASDVDYILQNTVTAGRDFHSTTGFPDLIRRYDFTVTGFTPLTQFMPGPITGLFFVLYMGDEEEIELADGRDSIVITPYASDQYQILHKGIAIPLTITTP